MGYKGFKVFLHSWVALESPPAHVFPDSTFCTSSRCPSCTYRHSETIRLSSFPTHPTSSLWLWQQPGLSMRAGQGLSPEPGRGQGALRPRMLVGWRRAAEGRGLQSGATPPLLRCPALERACSPTAPLPAGPTSLALPLSSDDSDTRWALVTASPAPAASQCRPALTSSSGRRPPPPRTDTGPHGRCCHRTPGWGARPAAVSCRRELPPAHAASGHVSLRQSAAARSQPPTQGARCLAAASRNHPAPFRTHPQCPPGPPPAPAWTCQGSSAACIPAADA